MTELEKRGVDNPRVVDLITGNPETGEVVLVMIEERPWGAVPDQLAQIESKFNAYLSYVQAGYLVRQYPQYLDSKVAFQLDCASPPQEEQRRFLDAVKSFAESESIRFVVNVDPTATTRPPSLADD